MFTCIQLDKIHFITSLDTSLESACSIDVESNFVAKLTFAV